MDPDRYIGCNSWSQMYQCRWCRKRCSGWFIINKVPGSLLFLWKWSLLFLSIFSLFPHFLIFPLLLSPFNLSILCFFPSSWQSSFLPSRISDGMNIPKTIKYKHHSLKFCFFFYFWFESPKQIQHFPRTLAGSLSIYFPPAVSRLAALPFHYVEFIHVRFGTKTVVDDACGHL